MREGAHVAIEKADLVLALVDPREVAAGVHQPHQKEPRLAARARRRRRAPRRSRPRRDRPGRYVSGTNTSRRCRFHSATASLTSVTPTRCPSATQQLVQPRRRQLLLAAGPLRRFRQQRLHPRADLRPTPAAPAAPLPSAPAAACSRYFRTVTRDNPKLSGHRPLRPPLHQHLVPNDMYLIHPEHPPADPGSAGIRQARHQALRWSTFRAAIGSLSERRAHLARSGSITVWATNLRSRLPTSA